MIDILILLLPILLLFNFLDLHEGSFAVGSAYSALVMFTLLLRTGKSLECKPEEKIKGDEDNDKLI